MEIANTSDHVWFLVLDIRRKNPTMEKTSHRDHADVSWHEARRNALS